MARKKKSPFPEADALLLKRAPDFYGIGALASRTGSRFRTFYKALAVIPVLDPAYEAWLKRFDAEKSPYIARGLLHSTISVPRLIHEPNEQPKTVISHVTLTAAYRANESQVLEYLGRANDPAAHIVTTLDTWAEGNERISALEKQSAEVCFEQFLFGVHGTLLAKQVELIAVGNQAVLDIVGGNKVA